MENKNKVILVVEDERALSEAIKIKLEKNGFDVLTARTVEQAKNYFIDVNHVDAIWLDHYLMGKENGLDLIAWCRNENNDICKEVPIFIVSNTATGDKVATYMSLGANKYFVKSNHRLDEIIKDISDSLKK